MSEAQPPCDAEGLQAVQWELLLNLADLRIGLKLQEALPLTVREKVMNAS